MKLCGYLHSTIPTWTAADPGRRGRQRLGYRSPITREGLPWLLSPQGAVERPWIPQGDPRRPTSPQRSLHIPRLGHSPPGSGPLPVGPGTGQRCLGPPCTPQAQPCPAPAGGSQNSRLPLCSADRNEASAGAGDLRGRGKVTEEGEGRGYSPSTGHLDLANPALVIGHRAGFYPVRCWTVRLNTTWAEWLGQKKAANPLLPPRSYSPPRLLSEGGRVEWLPRR